MVNYERAEAFIAGFQELAERANAFERAHSDEYYKSPQWIELDRELQGRLQAAKSLAEAISPGMPDRMEPNRGMYDVDWDEAVSACVQVRGIIRHAEEVAEILGTVGPSITAARSHRWIWEEASSAWNAGLSRAAVQAAAARVDHETQVILRWTDLTGVELGRQAWSSSAPEHGKPRLRPVGFGAPGDKSCTSALDGARVG